jgi:hypothetical protein
MAIKDRRDTVPKSKDVTDIKTEIAIARYEAFREPPTSKPDKSPKR